MRTLIVGSGPTGLFVGASLARRGHDVVSVDRDAGPSGGGWSRRGVMQFEHAHGFRPQVPMALQAEWPEAMASWLSHGAEPVEVPSAAGSPQVVGVLSRRPTFERALRQAAQEQRGLTLRTGHVDGLALDGGRVVGARIDGAVVKADLVVDASGRSGHFGRTRGTDSGPELDGDCGLAYVDRTYQLLPGAEPGPMTSAIAYAADFDGYQCLVFLHESGHFSVVFVRPTADAALKALRFESAFEAACRAVPALAEWTDPARARPDLGGARRRGTAQRLPPTGRHTGTGRGRGLGRDDDPDPRTRDRDGLHAGDRAPPASSTTAQSPPPWRNRSAPGATPTSSRGWPTTSPSTAAWSGAGSVTTSTRACR